MKTKIIILGAMMAGLFWSCSTEPLPIETGSPTGKATVTFTPHFQSDPDGSGTKAFSETPEISNLYLAVFSEGGRALIEYVKATPVTPAEENGSPYTYTAELKLSESGRVIHFLANAPGELGYGSDADALGSLTYSFDTGEWTGQDAYWGYLELDGIYDASDPRFDEIESLLSNVRLVRNFAKIKVKTSSPVLEITRFWISNFPDRSSAAPYNRAARRFETGYAGYEHASSAMTDGYMGFCPASAGLVSISELSDSKIDDIATAAGDAAYIYEREKPVNDPICIIVGGKYDGSETETFYKFELRDSDGNYLPVLRNFTYTLTIGEVKKEGEPSVEAALKSVASGAIDTDLSLRDLTDLSNGRSRIAVSHTEKIIFSDESFTLDYSFIPDVTTGEAVNTTLDHLVSPEGGYVDEEEVKADHLSYVTITSEAGMSGNVIGSFSVAAADNPDDGFRTVAMHPVAVGDIVKTEVFTVTGHVWNGSANKYETLSRTVSYQMREQLGMTLKITPDMVPAAVGEVLDLNIGIEDGLPKSIFTLDLKITTEQMTLTPSSKDLPISSEIGEDGKPAFFMTKAITWEEYRDAPVSLDGDGVVRKHFTCSFKTNTNSFKNVDLSFGQGDRILVSNSNFKLASAVFGVGDVTKKRFVNPRLDQKYLLRGQTSTISFGMSALPSSGSVQVRLKDMTPVNTEALVYVKEDVDGYIVYEMKVGHAEGESFEVIPADGKSYSYFQLTQEDFNASAEYDVPVKEYAVFSDLRFECGGLGYVQADKPAQAVFHSEYLPSSGSVTIHLKNAEPEDSSITGIDSDSDGFTEYVIPASGHDVVFPVVIRLGEGQTKASFMLTADGFEDSGVAEATIDMLHFRHLEILNLHDMSKHYVIGGRPSRISFALDEMPEDNTITLSLVNLTPGTGKTGIMAITPMEGGDYELTLKDTEVTLDVIPEADVAEVSFSLSEDNFEGASCSAQVRKLSFQRLKIVNIATADASKAYLLAGREARVSFMLEELPGEGEKISITLHNLTPGSVMSGIDDIEDKGSGIYELTVTDTNISLDVTVASGQASSWFKLSGSEFYDSDKTEKEIRTRCTIDWTKVHFVTDDPTYTTIKSKSIRVYDDAGCTVLSSNFETSLSINADGILTYPNGVKSYDVASGAGNTGYYFKFTNAINSDDNSVSTANPDIYIAGPMTISELAGEDGVNVTMNVQAKDYTLEKSWMIFSGISNGNTVYVKIGSPTATDNVTSFKVANNSGKLNPENKVTINCAKSQLIYFVSGTKKSSGYHINELRRTQTISLQ